MKNRKTKRYNLVISWEMWEELQSFAEEEQISIKALIVRCIKIGLYFKEMEQHYGQDVVVIRGDKEKNLIIL